MAKRGADKYLTDKNWDQEEDETEEQGEFSAASSDVLKQRKIIKAKRRCNNGEADSASSLFKGFSGFSSSAAAGSASSAPGASNAESPCFPLPLFSKRGNDSGSGENLSELNKSLLSWINDHVSKDPACDLTPVVKSYCEKVEKLSSSMSISSPQVSVETETPSADKKPESTSANSLPSGSVPLSELFRKSDDTWDCTTCYVTNKNADVKCVACTCSRPVRAAATVEATPSASSSAAAAAAAVAAVASLPVVGTSAQLSLADLFKKSVDEWECKGCWIRNKSTAMECVACGSKNAAGVAGGGDKSSEAEPVSTTATVTAAPSFSFAPEGGFSFKPAGGSLFSFGASAVSSTSSFGFKMASTGDEKTGTSTVGFKFGTGFNPFSSSLSSNGVFSKPVSSTSGEVKDEDNEDYVPPKVEPVAYVEEGAFYSIRCKLFYQKGGQWVERGLGNLFLKPSGDRTQLLIRTDNSLGNILLNILLTSEIPVSRQGANNVSLACVPNPPLESSKASKHPVCLLIRVKTGEMADELFAKINEHKIKE